MSAIKIIQAFAKKSLTKNQGSGITTLPSQFMAESKAGEIAAILQQAGMPLHQLDNFIKSEADLIKFLNIIKNAKPVSTSETTSGVVLPFKQKRSFAEEIELMKKSGDLVDVDDIKISEKITDREMFKNSNLNKPTIEGQMEKITGASNKINKIQKEIDEMYRPKTDAEIKAKFEKQNKEAAQRLKDKMKKDEPDDMATGGRAGFYTGGITDVEQSLADIGHGADAMNARTRLMSPNSQATTSTGLNYLLAEDNDNMRVPFENGGDFKQFQKEKMMQLMQEYQQYLKNKEIEKRQRPYMEKRMGTGPGPILEAAEGGRIGFSSGGDAGRRAFLKLLAALTGGAAAVKSGIIGLGEAVTKKGVSETVKKAAGSGQPPPYFFELIETIKKNGKPIKSYGERVKQTVAPSKDGKSELMLTEDLNTGDIQIKKIYKEGDEMVTKTEEMNFNAGRADEVTKKKPADDYEEVTSFHSRIYKDEFNDPNFEDGIDVEGIVKEIDVKKADGGRIGYNIGGLSKLGITGSSRRFLEKVFGKEKFARMIENDPELHRGMLEVVEMFRAKDKEGLKIYLQKFLPHMDDEMVEDFIIGSGDTAGIEGQLIRLGSGRDYKNKIEMIEEANNIRKLEDFDIDGVSKNAEGGRIGFMSGGGIFRAIIAKAAAAKGMKPYEFIKVTNYKGLPREVKMFMSPEDFAKLKSGQEQLYTNYIDMMKTRKNFQEQVEGGKKTPAKELFEHMEKTMDKQSYVPKTVTTDDIAEAELMVKNRFQKGRKDNAQGGIQNMLGE